MPGLSIVAKVIQVIVPDGYDLTYNGVLVNNDPATPSSVELGFTPGEAKSVPWSLKRNAGTGGHDVAVTSSFSPWTDKVTPNAIADAAFADPAGVSGTHEIDCPADAVAGTQVTGTFAANEV